MAVSMSIQLNQESMDPKMREKKLTLEAVEQAGMVITMKIGAEEFRLSREQERVVRGWLALVEDQRLGAEI